MAKEEKLVAQVQVAPPDQRAALYEQINAEGKNRKDLNQKLKAANDEIEVINKEFQQKKEQAKNLYNYAPYRANVWD